MNANTEFLNYIYQNSQMGLDATKQLMSTVKDPSLRAHLRNQANEYQEINDRARNMLHSAGKAERDLPVTEKLMSNLSISFQTILDKSPAHVAEMMMQGSTMGVIDITKNLKKYESADPDIRRLGKELLNKEEDGLKQWKEYLSFSTN